MTDILDTPMLPNDGDAETIGEYFQTLAILVWREQECFNGKRPFGNSGWSHDIYASLAAAGIIEATSEIYDEGGEDEYTEWDYDRSEMRRADKLIEQAIKNRFAVK